MRRDYRGLLAWQGASAEGRLGNVLFRDTLSHRNVLAGLLRSAADQGLYLGTSSWKYKGWLGSVYEQSRYIYRGRFSETRFNRHCLKEYGEQFQTVGVDAAYYQFPSHQLLSDWFDATPGTFLFSMKVTDEITLKRFPRLPRFGARAGTVNPDFLNSKKFIDLFLGPCSPWQARVGVLMFEFSRFHASDFSRGRDFVDALDTFLSELPSGWRYGVEIRNGSFLQPYYFEILRRHAVAHVFTSWDGMPSIEEQISVPGAMETADFLAARLLLRPGRSYAEAVQRFSPYQEIKEPLLNVRQATVELLGKARSKAKSPKAFIYVNNRLEGNAPQTIQGILESLGPPESAHPSSGAVS